MNTTVSQGAWITDPAAYRAGLQEKLSGRPPVEVLSATTPALRKIVADHPAAQLRARPFAGKWTPLEVIGHLCDVEWVDGFRIRLVLAQDSPVLTGMDQDPCVAAQRYNERDPRDLVQEFAELRSANLVLIRSLTPAQLQRIGRHEERGEESLGLMIEMLAGHDLHHLDQIARYLHAIAS